MKKDLAEKILLFLLKELKEEVFIQSEDAETGKIEKYRPKIEDRWGTIVISGEWDREDLKKLLLSIRNEDEEHFEDCEMCKGTGEVEIMSPVYPGEPHMAYLGDTRPCLCKGRKNE